MSGLNNEEYQVVIGNDTTSYIIDDLEPARNYSFYIVAYMPMGASRMSDQVSQHTLEDGKHRALSPPTFLAINHSGRTANMHASDVCTQAILSGNKRDWHSSVFYFLFTNCKFVNLKICDNLIAAIQVCILVIHH